MSKDTKDKTGDFAGILERFSPEQFSKLQKMLAAEKKRRGTDGKSVTAMSDSEFRSYVNEQFSKADKAAREADLRSLLAGKAKTKDKSKKSQPTEGEYENE